jgi:hypothetical protein
MRDQSTAGHPAPGTATATTFREPEDPRGTADPTNRTDPTDRDLTEEEATSTYASTEARADAAEADGSTAGLTRTDDAARLDPDEAARDEAARDEAARDRAATDEAELARPAAASTILDERGRERVDERVEDGRVADGAGRADDLSDGELSERAPEFDGETASGDEAASVDEALETPAVVPVPLDENQYVVDDGVATDDGTAPSTVEELGALWAGPETDAMRERWREIQLRFVDDPRSAADEAAGLVDEAAQTLVAAIEARRSELTRSHPAGAADAVEPGAPEQPRQEGETEQLRLAVQRYREFLDQVLKL